MSSSSVTPGGAGVAGAALPPPASVRALALYHDEEPETMFIDEVPDYLKCSICLCVLKNPYQVNYSYNSAKQS